MKHTITVGATGEASAEPDITVIDLGVAVVRPTVAEATAEGAAAAHRLVDALVTAGVAADDIHTSRYSLQPEYDYSGSEPRLRGYRLANTVTAQVRDVAATGAVLDAATAAGGDATVVDGIRFSLGDSTALVSAARAAAWESARAKAAQLADLAGAALGAVLAINEGAGPAGPRPLFAAAKMAAEAAPPILPGETSVSVSLTVTFAIGSSQ